MIIGIDIRSLWEPNLTGVGAYTFCLLEALFSIDKKNEYRLFYNSYTKVDKKLLNFNYPKVKFFEFKIPNKIFNASLKFLHYPKIDSLLTRGNLEPLDLFFIPNHNFCRVAASCFQVITVHDLSFQRYPEFYSRKSRLWHQMINPRRLIQEAQKIIAVSESTKSDLIELYSIDSTKIKVVHSGVKKKNLNPELLNRVKIKYDLPEKFILYLGTVERRKNIEGLIRAFENLKKNPELKLIMAGVAGLGYNEIYKVAKKSNLAKRLKFLGYIDDEDKPYLYKLASLFVYPSFYEGFGFPPLEAMNYGTPVVASFVSSLGEILEEAALLVDPYNINELTEAMDQILKNDQLKEELIKRGLKQSEKFSWQKCAEETLEIFKELKIKNSKPL